VAGLTKGLDLGASLDTQAKYRIENGSVSDRWVFVLERAITNAVGRGSNFRNVDRASK
jgi:hypothetical protein